MLDAVIRLLQTGDEPELERFLAPLADSSLFLLANARKGGLVDQGQPFQSTYAAAFEEGVIVGVAACSWLGSVVVQAPRQLDGVVREAIRASGRQVTAMIGPYQQAVAACAAIGRSPLSLERELLFAVDLAALEVPADLATEERASPLRGGARRAEHPTGLAVCRPARREELPMLAEWRARFIVETNVEREGTDLRSRARVATELLFADGALFVLERDGAVVSMAGFNARIAEMAQVGGVYTPAELRGRGYARCAVAGALLAARTSGASRGILFTAESNVPAQRSYRAIGFRPIGDYGLLRI
jgi:RimJ/RimL family protein N-acetyltransferase